MLILIAGITGTVGLPCAAYAITHGHQVRGIGRDPEKLPMTFRTKLESFVTSSGIYDIPALDKAVANVDAVICAYGYTPEVVVEGQLLLLRAAERAGVKVGSASTISIIYSLTSTHTNTHL
jgi:nucleoside-diphosphate-sugar epimerase